MSLEFKDTPEAISLFSGIKDIATVKKTAIMIAAEKEGLISSNGSLLDVDESKSEAKERVTKQLRNLAVIDQYCEYIKNKDREGYRVELMVDS